MFPSPFRPFPIELLLHCAMGEYKEGPFRWKIVPRQPVDLYWSFFGLIKVADVKLVHLPSVAVEILAHFSSEVAMYGTLGIFMHLDKATDQIHAKAVSTGTILRYLCPPGVLGGGAPLSSALWRGVALHALLSPILFPLITPTRPTAWANEDWQTTPPRRFYVLCLAVIRFWLALYTTFPYRRAAEPLLPFVFACVASYVTIRRLFPSPRHLREFFQRTCRRLAWVGQQIKRAAEALGRFIDARAPTAKHRRELLIGYAILASLSMTLYSMVFGVWSLLQQPLPLRPTTVMGSVWAACKLSSYEFVLCVMRLLAFPITASVWSAPTAWTAFVTLIWAPLNIVLVSTYPPWVNYLAALSLRAICVPMLPLLNYTVLIAPVISKLRVTRRHRQGVAKAEAEAAAGFRESLKSGGPSTTTTWEEYAMSREPGHREIIDPLVSADGGYTLDAVIDALLEAEGDESKALERLRPEGFVRTFSASMKTMATACRRVAAAAGDCVDKACVEPIRMIALWYCFMCNVFVCGGACRGDPLQNTEFFRTQSLGLVAATFYAFVTKDVT
mmetsp:Transcript_85365/g.241814  ORF Transcript_85365/g.241814 Transcript_85365/m.241814 type:complete len:558 (-) Transcript_85365:111-1784(-)